MLVFCVKLVLNHSSLYASAIQLYSIILVSNYYSEMGNFSYVVNGDYMFIFVYNQTS